MNYRAWWEGSGEEIDCGRCEPCKARMRLEEEKGCHPDFDGCKHWQRVDGVWDCRHPAGICMGENFEKARAALRSKDGEVEEKP